MKWVLGRGVATAKTLGGPSEVTMTSQNYDVTVTNIPHQNIGGARAPPAPPVATPLVHGDGG